MKNIISKRTHMQYTQSNKRSLWVQFRRQVHQWIDASTHNPSLGRDIDKRYFAASSDEKYLSGVLRPSWS